MKIKPLTITEVEQPEPFKGESYRRGFLEGHKAGQEEYRQFILNVLEGIDYADADMTGGETKAIRLAIASRII